MAQGNGPQLSGDDKPSIAAKARGKEEPRPTSENPVRELIHNEGMSEEAGRADTWKFKFGSHILAA